MLGRIWLSMAWVVGGVGVLGLLTVGIFGSYNQHDQAEQRQAEMALANDVGDVTLERDAIGPTRV
jgi:hypothetical protein